MGVKIVIPANSSEALENAYPVESSFHIEEYLWDLFAGMEQYIAEHCRSLSKEIRKIRLKWLNVLPIESLIRLTSESRNLFWYGRKLIKIH